MRKNRFQREFPSALSALWANKYLSALRKSKLFWAFVILKRAALVAALFLMQGCSPAPPDNRASVEIKSEPPGAKVFAGTAGIGETPLKIRVGGQPAIILKIEKPGWNPEWVRVTCEPKSVKTVAVSLQPVTASVLVTSQPSGAAVIVGGSAVGETPLVLGEQTVGKHSAQLKKSGYVPVEISWDIDGPAPKSVHASISSNVGTLDISSAPAGARVFINKTPKGTTPCSEKLEEGKYDVRVEKDGYHKFEKTCYVTRNKSVSVKADLLLLPCVLGITTKPSGSRVFIDGKQVSDSPVTLDTLSPGKHTVKAERDGYDPAESEITLSPGQKSDISLTLESIAGGIALATNPSGISVYLDGKLIGVTEPGENKNISKVFEKGNVPAGNHTVTLAHKRAVPPQKTLQIKVVKGQTFRHPQTVQMWIANAVVKFKDGKEMTGLLSSENPSEIIFEPEPGVKVTYKRSEVASITPLKLEE
jgi:hypothetical protein